jgi:hypothetical protein
VDDSGVTRDIALRALRASGPPNSPCKLELAEHPIHKWFITITDGNKARLEYIPPALGRRLVNRLSQDWKVPKGWFYEPLMIPGEEDKKPPC